MNTKEEVYDLIAVQPEVARLAPVVRARRVYIGESYLSILEVKHGLKVVLLHPKKIGAFQFGMLNFKQYQDFDINAFNDWFIRSMAKLNRYLSSGGFRVGGDWDKVLKRRREFALSLSPEAQEMIKTPVGKKIRIIYKGVGGVNYPIKLSNLFLDEKSARAVLNLLATMPDSAC